jgi:hypothetical protein
MTTPATYEAGDRVRSLIHRHGILPINPGDVGSVTATGIRNYTEPYVLVTLQVTGGAVHTSFAPDEIETLR